MTVQVLFRGEMRDVCIEAFVREPDIGYECVEWHFLDEELKDVSVTDEEEAEIIEALWEFRDD